MAEDIKISVQLVDNISKELKEINSKITDMGNKAKIAGQGTDVLGESVGNLVKGFLTFEAVKQAAGFLLDCAKSAGEAEIAFNKVSIAMKGKGLNDPAMIKSMADYAKQLQFIIGFEDEQIMSAQALGVRYNILGEANDRLVKGAADLANTLGMDLESATMMLARNIQKDTGELGRLGLQVNGTGGSVERFNSIMKALEDTFGGGSQAKMDSYTGKVKAMDIAWGEFKETIGTKVIPVMNELITGLTTTFKIMSGDEEAKKIHALETEIVLTKETLSLNTLSDEKRFTYIQKLLDAEGKLRDLKNQKPIGSASNIPTGTGNVGLTSDEIAAANVKKEKEKKDAEERIKAADDELQNQRNLRDKAYADQVDQDQTYLALKREEVDKLNELEQSRRDNAYEVSQEIIKNTEAEKQARFEAADTIIGNALAITSMYKDNSREMFAMTQALSIAQATMNTFQGATKALAVYPPPFGAIAAASVVALGLAQVAQIASTPYKAALGADFITSGRRLMLVGDNPGGKERVQVTPMSSPNINGSKNTTTNTTRIIPVVIIRGGNIRNELEKSSHLRELDWERILPKGVLK